MNKKIYFPLFLFIFFPLISSAALSDTITVKKLANDGVTVLNQTTVTMEYLKDNFIVYGDDSINYYYQTATYDEYDLWNPNEDVNVESGDMGTRKGTEIKDILGLVGGASSGDTIKIARYSDMTFNYETIYNYVPRRGRITLTWRKNGSYSFSESPQLIFMADDSVNPWGICAFGIWDMHETLPESNWKYFYNGGIYYPRILDPSDPGYDFDMRGVRTITINSTLPPPPVAAFSATPVSGTTPLEVSFTDSSTNATSWCWDIDNSGNCDYTTQNATHTYTEPGTYTVKLTATNDSGSDPETKTDYIVVGQENESFPDANGNVTITNYNNEARVISNSQVIIINENAGTNNPNLNVSSLTTNGSSSLPQITVNTKDGIKIDIPNSTTVTSSNNTWNGVLKLPRVTAITLPQSQEETKTPVIAIEIGLSNQNFSFDKGVRILFPNQAGNRVGFQKPGESFTEITETCLEDSQAAGDGLSANGSCKITVGSDLIVWTKHFTSFAVFFSTPIAQGGVVMLINQNPPEPPETGYVFKINNNANTTLSRNVTLTIDGGLGAKRMAIGNNNVFTSQETYSITKQWTLTQGNGIKEVCIKLYNEFGYSSEPVCDTIYLEESDVSLNDLIANTKYKQNNNQVKQLQENLQKLGFFPNDIECTGYYGSITKKAVIKYQINQQLISKSIDQFTKNELINILLQLIEVLK